DHADRIEEQVHQGGGGDVGLYAHQSGPLDLASPTTLQPLRLPRLAKGHECTIVAVVRLVKPHRCSLLPAWKRKTPRAGMARGVFLVCRPESSATPGQVYQLP